jgi:zinc protease
MKPKAWEAALSRRCIAALIAVGLSTLPALAQDLPPLVSPTMPAPIIAPAEIRISDRVILVRDERMAQTHFTLVIHAGCLEEEPECGGVAHYLEHLLLVGRNADHTETAFRFFADGYANGWTSHKATAYTYRLAPRRADEGSALSDLERLFGFYANRLRGFEVSAADAVRERNVVLQEYQLRTGNTPFGRFGVQFERALLPDHPLGQRVIGSPETIGVLSVEQARRFHARWYAPNNATIILAGNLDTEAVRAAVARSFGAVEPRPLPERTGWQAPTISAEHTVLKVQDPQVKRRMVSYAKLVKVPEETATLRSAQLLLNGFLSSQFAGSPNDVLVEQQGLTDGISAGVTRLLPGLYRIGLSAEPTPETDPDDLARAMRRYLDDMITKGGLEPSTLERLKRRSAADWATTSQSGERTMGRAVQWVANGDPYDTLADMPGHVAATTQDDVARLLTLLAGPGRELTGMLLPEARQDETRP